MFGIPLDISYRDINENKYGELISLLYANMEFEDFMDFN
jgi:hypothetical protein